MLVGNRCCKKNTGLTTLGTLRLFSPPSMTKMDRLGSASASLPATIQPAVPPVMLYMSDYSQASLPTLQGRLPLRFHPDLPPAMMTSTSLMSSASLLYTPILNFATSTSFCIRKEEDTMDFREVPFLSAERKPRFLLSALYTGSSPRHSCLSSLHQHCS